MPRAYETVAVAVALPFCGMGSAINSEAMRPGQIVENVAAGTCKKNTRVAAGTVPKRIVTTDTTQGGTLDDTYASGTRTMYQDFHSGDEVLLMLKAGENASIEELLRVDNTGCVLASGSNAPYAYAIEALDLSASGAVDTLILARLL